MAAKIEFELSNEQSNDGYDDVIEQCWWLQFHVRTWNDLVQPIYRLCDYQILINSRIEFISIVWLNHAKKKGHTISVIGIITIWANK